ncbi:MAG: hypothetical protein Q4C05_01590 [Akkermansia sp.]|nr:hypothetical protein [Akkermansia sp.]
MGKLWGSEFQKHNKTDTMIDPSVISTLADAGMGNIGLGLVTIGAGLGIGLIGSKAAEATGRNPGASGKVLVISIVLAALIEGVALLIILAK